MKNKLDELRNDAGAMIEYRKWKELPMTRRVLDAIRDELLNSMLSTVSPMPATGLLTEQMAMAERERAGFARCLFLVENLDAVKQQVPEMPKEDYLAENEG